MPSLDHYATPLALPMSIDTFARFPALAGYQVAYAKGQASITYRPRLNMARLRVARRQAKLPEGISMLPVDLASSHDALARVFLDAFAKLAPLDTMPATTRRHAVDAALRHTTSGGDGALFLPACLAAVDANGEAAGAAVVTHIGLRTDEWPEPELPPKLVNLTWLFVATKRQRQGIATALLAGVMNALADAEIPWLVSHVPEDNGLATLWHWRQGFELVSWMRRR